MFALPDKNIEASAGTVEKDKTNPEPSANQKVAAIGENILDSTPERAKRGRKTTTIISWPNTAAD